MFHISESFAVVYNYKYSFINSVDGRGAEKEQDLTATLNLELDLGS